MTSFGALFKAVSRPKFRQMNVLLLFELAAIAVTAIWIAIQGNFASDTLVITTFGWSPLPAIVGVVLIAISHEKIYKADTFRLIPIEETKFYIINLLSSLANIVYFAVVQLVLYVIGIVIAIGFEPIGDWSLDLTRIYQTGNVFLVAFGVIVIALLLNLVFWSTISFVHLVTTAASSFLPKFRQRALNIVVYGIVIFLTVRVTGLIGSGINWISQQMFNTSSLYYDFGRQMWVMIIAMVLVILIEGAINVLCLKRWVETDAN